MDYADKRKAAVREAVRNLPSEIASACAEAIGEAIDEYGFAVPLSESAQQEDFIELARSIRAGDRAAAEMALHVVVRDDALLAEWVQRGFALA